MEGASGMTMFKWRISGLEQDDTCLEGFFVDMIPYGAFFPQFSQSGKEPALF
jgi:hypothetical protein